MDFRFLFCQNFFLFHLKLFFAQRSGLWNLFIKHGSRTPFVYHYFIAMKGARQLCYTDADALGICTAVYHV